MSAFTKICCKFALASWIRELATAIEYLKIIVLAVTAASKSTDNAVTAITKAILESRNVVFTNKLDDESLKQLQT